MMKISDDVAFQGYTPNQAAMNPDGLVTVDYSDVGRVIIDYRFCFFITTYIFIIE